MAKYEKLKEMLCEELDNITKKGELSAVSLDAIDKLTHSIKSLETIIAMTGESNEYHRADMADYSGARYRKRDSMGRYSRENGNSYNGYSYDDAKADFISEMHTLMNTAPPEMRSKVQRFVSELERE